MLLEILPSALFHLPNVKALFHEGKSAIFHKVLDKDLLKKDMYLSSVAILYLVKGKQVLDSYDGAKIEVEQGNLVLLSRDMYLVSDFVADSNEFEAVIFSFDESLIDYRSSVISKGEISKTLIPVLRAEAQVVEYMKSLLTVYRDTKNSAEILNLKLSELLALIELQDGSSEFTSQFNAYLLGEHRREILDFMQRNCFKNLTVEDYAVLTGRSKSTFIREFKKIYQTTPKQWLIDQRLKKAHTLLIDTDMNVTDTAFDVGYENVSHFIRAYKNKYGQTPKQLKSDNMIRIEY